MVHIYSGILLSHKNWASLVAQLVKNLPVMQETRVQFLGQEDPLKQEMATHSSILAWRIPWTEAPGRLQSMGWQIDMTVAAEHACTARSIHPPAHRLACRCILLPFCLLTAEGDRPINFILMDQ